MTPGRLGRSQSPEGVGQPASRYQEVSVLQQLKVSRQLRQGYELERRLRALARVHLDGEGVNYFWRHARGRKVRPSQLPRAARAKAEVAPQSSVEERRNLGQVSGRRRQTPRRRRREGGTPAEGDRKRTR